MNNDKTYCDLLDEYFNAITAASFDPISGRAKLESQERIDKARIALVNEYELRAGKHAATRGVVGKASELPAMPDPSITLAESTALMQALLQRLPFFDSNWHRLNISIRRTPEGIGVRSVKWETEL